MGFGGMRLGLLLLGLGVPVPGARGQDAGTGRPLPEVAVLMHEVEAHQRADEAALKNYIYRSVETAEQSGRAWRGEKTRGGGV